MWSVIFVFLSYLDRNVVKGDFLSRALNAEKESEEMFSMINGTFCAKMSIIGDHFLYLVSDGAEVVRTVVSPTGQLVDCSVTVNQMQVKSFMHECRLGLKEKGAGSLLEIRFARMDEAKMMCEELKESAHKNRFGKNEKVLKRSKRGFTYPGTLWCGAGNMADEYGQLGEFADTDSCCRTHDHCPHVIHAFSSKYGHTNFKWHSICHCDCDEALKSCLRQVNDTSSRVIGQAFFNVIGVPCFEFAYEEQCAERHWYGICKRYEKLPIAMLRDAVPYDFGGIDVIDELPIAPSKPKESKESKEEKPESSTQNTVFGPDEPSLRNVVTAAEDFIKVLATVSTSQSSAADSNKDEAQSSEKKKKTGKKKKTNKKPKGKGKGRKRKQKANARVRAEEGALASPSGNRAEEVLTLKKFISESQKYDPAGMNPKPIDHGEYELRVKEEPSNEVMKDEPVRDKETVSRTTTPTSQMTSGELNSAELMTTKPPTETETNVLLRVKSKGHKIGKRKKNKKAISSSEYFSTNTTQNSHFPFGPPTTSPNVEQQRFSEQQLFSSTTSTPIVIPKDQRIGSKGRLDRKGRKKRRKVNPAALTVPADHQDSSVDGLNVVPFIDLPTAQSVPTSEQELSHGPEIYRENIQVTELSFPVNVLEQHRSKESRLRNKKRKTVISPTSKKTFLFHSNYERLSISPTTAADSDVALKHFESNAVTQQTQLSFFTTAAPTVREIVPWYTTRQPCQTRKQASVIINDESTHEQTKPVSLLLNVATSGMLQSEKPMTTTSAALIMSPLQLSIEKVKAQFNRKKRRKHTRLNRQA